MNANRDDDDLSGLPTEAAVESASLTATATAVIYALQRVPTWHDQPSLPRLRVPLILPDVLWRSRIVGAAKKFSAIDATSIDQTDAASCQQVKDESNRDRFMHVYNTTGNASNVCH